MRLVWWASVLVCAVLPAATLVALFAATIEDGSSAMDFRQFYRGADAIASGEDPYPGPNALLTASGRPYVYPPFPAFVAMPLTLLPLRVAELVVMVTLVGVVLATLAVLGVRDWRCYGVAFLWPPVLSAIQTSNVTLWFGLAAAILWRYRDRLVPSSAGLGITLATKFLLWPLVVWLAATRRLASAALACAVGAGLMLGSWAAIGFTGLRAYPDLLRRLEDTIGKDAYTVNNVALDLGASDSLARAAWLAVGLGLLAAVVVRGLKGDERNAFVFAIAAALALSPLVWLHYFALLLVVVALTRQTLGVVWFVPLAMLVGPGSGNPTLVESLVVLGAAGLTIVFALRAAGPRPEPTPPAAEPVSVSGAP